MRKSRFFQKEAYISIDFLKKEVEVIRIEEPGQASSGFGMPLDLGPGKGLKQISFIKPEVKPNNAIKTELESFCSAIINNTVPPVTIEDGYHALEVAYMIINEINHSLTRLV